MNISNKKRSIHQYVHRSELISRSVEFLSSIEDKIAVLRAFEFSIRSLDPTKNKKLALRTLHTEDRASFSILNYRG